MKRSTSALAGSAQRVPAFRITRRAAQDDPEDGEAETGLNEGLLGQECRYAGANTCRRKAMHAIAATAIHETGTYG